MELQDTLFRADNILTNLHDKSDNSFTQEEMIRAIEDSVDEIHKSEDTAQSQEMVLVNNLIAESVL